MEANKHSTHNAKQKAQVPQRRGGGREEGPEGRQTASGWGQLRA